jgi:hypothetical protein
MLDPAMYVRVFEQHREGDLILQELSQVFARRAQLKGGIDAVLQTYHSDGQRSVVEWILNRINMANGAEPNADE